MWCTVRTTEIADDFPGGRWKPDVNEIIWIRKKLTLKSNIFIEVNSKDVFYIQEVVIGADNFGIILL